jgi:hypothetical protein
MSDYAVVGTARLEYDDDEMDRESAKENLREMVLSGQISLDVRTEDVEDSD